MHLHFIHGFLGSPEDWNLFTDQFNGHKLYFHAIEDFMPASCAGKNYFHEWARNFNSFIFSQNKNISKNILIGYSLGGRLALHALLENDLSSKRSLQTKWDSAIIISSNPGLNLIEEKVTRIKNDEAWASRFLHEKWEDVITAWNSQGVFAGVQNNLKREKKNFNKKKIAQMLTEFSLGKQENLREKIKKLEIPLLWLAGEKDSKFTAIAKEMNLLNSNIKSIIFTGIGHRVPWEVENFSTSAINAEFKQQVLEFINFIDR